MRVFLALLVGAALVAGSPARGADGEPDSGDKAPAAKKPETDGAEQGHALGLDEQPVPLPTAEQLPHQPRALVELGPGYLRTGALSKGWELPTGAVWTPSLWIFGEARIGASYFETGSEQRIEAPLRLDLFATLQLSATERLVVGVSPLHQEGRFSTYTFRPEGDDGWQGEENLDVTTIFFEGDFGEIFPRLDKQDRHALDYGFAIGRQSLVLQDGIFLNDLVDSIGVVHHDLFTIPGAASVRLTGLFGWGNIHRNDGLLDRDASLALLTTETDVAGSTLTADLAWVGSRQVGAGGGDGLYWGFGATQRLGRVNTTFRALGSYALDEETSAVSDGHLLFAELSITPPRTSDLLYLSAFWAIDRFSSVARDPTAGGPLGRTGILFASVGLGRWQPALDNRADDAFGAALGYQRFWNDERTQLVLEAGGRGSTADGPGSAAVGARLAQKLGTRLQLRGDGYVSGEDGRGPRWGLRTELSIRF